MLKVRKFDGRIEDFNPNKLMRTCLRAGGDEELCEKIVKEVEKNFSGVVPTKQILNFVLKKLKEYNARHVYLRYNLKYALEQLHPDFEFEFYVAELLKYEGYNIIKKKDKMFVHGKCMDHEVDVIILEKTDKILVECKHHYRERSFTDLDVVMKMHSMLIDVNYFYGRYKGWIITNTKFTEHAKKYAKCYRIKLTCWNYPEGNGINDIIERHKAYPLTLIGIDFNKRKFLAKFGIYDTKSLYNSDEWVFDKVFGKRKEKVKELLKDLYES